MHACNRQHLIRHGATSSVGSWPITLSCKNSHGEREGAPSVAFLNIATQRMSCCRCKSVHTNYVHKLDSLKQYKREIVTGKNLITH